MVKSKDLRKKVLFITSRGVEFGAGSPYEGWMVQEPAPGMGVTDIQFIHANGLDMETKHENRGARRSTI